MPRDAVAEDANVADNGIETLHERRHSGGGLVQVFVQRGVRGEPLQAAVLVIHHAGETVEFGQQRFELTETAVEFDDHRLAVFGQRVGRFPQIVEILTDLLDGHPCGGDGLAGFVDHLGESGHGVLQVLLQFGIGEDLVGLGQRDVGRLHRMRERGERCCRPFDDFIQVALVGFDEHIHVATHLLPFVAGCGKRLESP